MLVIPVMFPPQTLTQLVERGAPAKDQVVAVLDLREEQAVLTPRLFALSFGKERGEASQPFLTTVQKVLGSQ